MKYFIKTFGCQMNVADSQRIDTILEKRGYKKAKDQQEADLIIINSCIVRESAENRVYGLINNLRKLKKEIILTGCLAGWGLRDKTGKNLNRLKKKLGDGIEIILTEDIADFEIEPKRLCKKAIASQANSTYSQTSFAYVPISNGCNHFCSYCIVPSARGREIYRSSKEILNEAQSALKKGFSKIMLLGQNVNCWKGKGKVETFPQLLEKIARLDKLKEITFMSANPWDFSDQLIAVIAQYPNISREIHLPVQSGDDQILKKMNRSYTVKQYLKLIGKIRKKIPQVKLTTDIIIGFPGETERAFQNTVDLCKKVGFKRAFIAKYSPRPGTVAKKLYEDNVPPPEKKRRWRLLNKLVNF